MQEPRSIAEVQRNIYVNAYPYSYTDTDLTVHTTRFKATVTRKYIEKFWLPKSNFKVHLCPCICMKQLDVARHGLEGRGKNQINK